MKSLSLADCYRILELPYGAPIPTVIDSWRVLSQIYHPDKHKRDSAAYHKALEKQKQLNNARDILKEWFEKHPGQLPPRPQKQTTGPRPTAAHKEASKNPSDSKTAKSSEEGKATASSGYYDFDVPKSPETLRDKLFCLIEGDYGYNFDPNPVQIVLHFVMGFGPLFANLALAAAMFPDLTGHYPDWLAMSLLVLSFAEALVLFFFYGTESDVWKHEVLPHYARSDDSPRAVVEHLVGILTSKEQGSNHWGIVKRKLDEEHQTFKIHARARIEVYLFGTRFQQTIDSYINVFKRNDQTSILAYYRLHAPGHRFKALQRIYCLNKAVDDSAGAKAKSKA